MKPTIFSGQVDWICNIHGYYQGIECPVCMKENPNLFDPNYKETIWREVL